MRRLPVLFLLIAALAVGFVTPAAAGTEDDEAIAADAVLTEDDVAPPSGAVCRKVRAAIKAADRAPHAVTAFEDGGGTSVESRVIVYRNVKAARAPLAAYTDSKGPRCVESEIQEDLQENAEPGTDYEFSGGRSGLDLGDDGLVYQITLTSTDPEGESSEFYLEFGLVRVGRGVMVMTVASPGEPFAGSEDLATLVVDRLTEGLG
jgi:hypothetical protein